MIRAPLRPVIAPTLVGRDLPLSALDHLITQLGSRIGSIGLVSGEAGIGKSRLVNEAARRFLAATHGTVLQGVCFETDRSLPYAPFLDLLRTLPGGHGDTLGTLLSHSTGDLDKRRTFEELARCIVNSANDGPVLVVLEDLHWCDDVSLECIQLLSRRMIDRPVLLLLTWRRDEATEGLTHCLAALDRTRIAVDLPLERLDTDDVAQMLRAIFDQPQPIRSDFLHAITTLTDGNPFFIEEVLTALVASGDIYHTTAGWTRRELAELQIPRSVRDAVASRVGRLSPNARRALDIAAVIGQRVELPLLQALAGWDDATLLPLLRELVAAQLLTDVSASQLQFRHALTREAVYAQLLARERQALHRAVAWAIEELHPDQLDAHVAALSYHYAAAEDWARAYDYASRAAEHAERRFAPRAVVEHTSRAVAAASALHWNVPAELYHRRGAAYATLGAFEPARSDFQDSRTIAMSTTNVQAEWQSLLDLGELWMGHDYQRAGGYLEQALALARDLGDPRALAQSLVMAGSWHINSERPLDAERCLTDALVLFEQLADRPGQALAIDLLAIVADLRGDIARMYERHVLAIALYRELGDRQGLSSTLATFVCSGGGAIFDSVGMPVLLASEDAVSSGLEAIAIAREIDWRSGEAYALAVLALHHAYRGQLDLALERASASYAIASEIGHREWTICACLALAEAELQRLQPVAARAWLEEGYEIARTANVPHFLYLNGGFLASCCAGLGDSARAEEIINALRIDPSLSTIGQRAVHLARGDLALARSDATAAVSIADQLIALSPDPTEMDAIPRVALLRGQAMTALGHFDDAALSLQAALDGATRRGIRPLVWRIQLGFAHLHRSMGAPDRADQAIATARQLVVEISQTIADYEAREAFVGRFEHLVAGSESRTTPDPAPLTLRERDVAVLVARGLSNRQIAGELFIGERTVETHVSNILGKLGVATRAQIAAWSVASGLARSGQ